VALIPGTRLGPYEVVSLLGAGGMGEVYRARDTKLNRVVALKILPEAFAAEGDRIARFRREAQVLASLNHQNIAAIYGFEDSGTTHALVLELVEGPTLADRIARGPLPVGEALPLAIQIAEALEAAHAQGIVHRDLKPANIKVRDDGTVKVLDFGLAKALEPASALSPELAAAPTITTPAMTSVGTLLGTAAYMSPEQARGRPADSRSDVWALGCVLYEMLTKTRAFDGVDVAETLAFVLTRSPDWKTLPRETPAAVERLLRRALEKDRRHRLADAADCRLELEEALRERSGGAGQPSQEPGRTPRLLVPVLTFVLGAAIAGTFAWLVRRPVTRTAVSMPIRSSVGIGPADALRSDVEDQIRAQGFPGRTTMALSGDGRLLVFSALERDAQRLYARRLDQLEAAPLAGTEGASNPFFSPDGQWVAFWSGGALKKVALAGGPPTTICETAKIFGATWGVDGRIVFARAAGGLWQVQANGGSPTALTTVNAAKGEVSHRLPQFLPGGALMFTVTRSYFPTWSDDTQIVAQSPSTGALSVLVDGGADARYASSGHLLYMRRGSLMAVAFDPARLRVTSGPVTMVSDVMQAANMPNIVVDSGAGQFSVSDTGSLVYVPGGVYTFPDRSLAFVTRSGDVQLVSAPSRAYIYPRLSPDGSQVLVSTQGDRNIWLFSLMRGTLTRLTVDGRSLGAIWTRDGKRVVFGSSVAGGTENLYWKTPDPDSPAERLSTSDHAQRPSSLSPDGRRLLFWDSPSGGASASVYDVAIGGGEPARPATTTRFDTSYAEFSPDGRWLAFTSTESGRQEVYVQPYPGPGPRVLISTGGGTAPMWGPGGRELFYVVANPLGNEQESSVMGVSLTTGATMSVGLPKRLFSGRFLVTAAIRGYDMTADGQRFLMVQVKDRPPFRPSQIVLVQNWFEELNQHMPSK
jgi:serine/threonine-protein kinase